MVNQKQILITISVVLTMVLISLVALVIIDHKITPLPEPEEQVIEQTAMSSEKSIISFSLPSLNVSGGSEANYPNIITFNVSLGQDITHIVPQLILSANATISPAPSIPQDFSKPVRYTVTAQDGSKQDYYVRAIIYNTPQTILSSEKSIFSFSIPSLNLTWQGDENSSLLINFNVSATTNLSALVPSIVISNNATITPASGISQDFSNSMDYIVTAQDGSSKDYLVSVNIIPSSPQNVLSGEKSILSFSFPSLATQGVIDTYLNIITINFPAGTDVTHLISNIVISPNSTIIPSSGTAQDFTNPVRYNITAQDGTSQIYNVQVNVAQQTVLSSNKSITSFKFQSLNVNATINQTTSIINVKVPAGTNLANLTPIINVSQYANVTTLVLYPYGDSYNGAAPGVWTFDVVAAKALALNNSRSLLMVEETSSATCAWCNQLENDVFKKLEWKRWVESKGLSLVRGDVGSRQMMLVDSELDGIYRDYLSKHGVVGWPYFFVLEVLPTANITSSSSPPSTIYSPFYTNPLNGTSWSLDQSNARFIGAFRFRAGENSFNGIPAQRTVSSFIQALQSFTGPINDSALSFVKYGRAGSGTMMDFSVPVKYTVTAQDGSTRDYLVNVSIAANQNPYIPLNLIN